MKVLVEATLPLSLLIAGAALADRGLARASARRLLWALATGAGLVLPALLFLLPATAAGAPVLGGRATQVAMVSVASHLPAPAVWPFVLAVGIAALLVHLGLGLFLAWRLTWDARPVARAMPLGISVPVREGPAVRAPMTVGILAPVVLVPPAAARWPEARWSAVLRHEAAHAAGRDPALLVVAGLARALSWFNPFVWYATGRLRHAVEQAADDAVLAGGVAGPDYARCLLEVARAGSPGLLPAAAFGRRFGLETRIRAVLAPGRRDPVGRRRALVTAVAAVLVLAGAALATPRLATADSAPMAIHLTVGESVTLDYGPLRYVGCPWPGAVRLTPGKASSGFTLTGVAKGQAFVRLYPLQGETRTIPIVVK